MVKNKKSTNNNSQKKSDMLILLLVIAILSFGLMQSPMTPPFDTNETLAVNVTNEHMVFIDEVHYQNHLGTVYFNNFNTTMASDAIQYFMACPTTKNVHFISMEIKAEGAPVLIELFENPTIISNGTSFNLTSSNRANVLPQTVNTFVGTTISNDGLKLYRDQVTTAGGNKVQNQFLQTGEIILATGSCYTIKLTNQDGNNNNILGNLFIYEE